MGKLSVSVLGRCRSYTVADPSEGPGAPPPPPPNILRPNCGPKGRKKILRAPPPPPPTYLRVRMTAPTPPPTLSEGLDPPPYI